MTENSKRYVLKRSQSSEGEGISANFESGGINLEKEQGFQIDYANELNPQQLAAVRNLFGPQLVIAGAGSGKTRTLVYRVSYLIEAGVDPSKILLMTFTRKSAQEMMKRASIVLDERCRRIKGGTFHSFANLTLRRFAEKLGFDPSFTILDRGDAEDLLNVVRNELGHNTKDKRFPKKRTLLNVISKSTNTGRAITDIIADEYPQFIDESAVIEQLAVEFQIYKKERSVMDYDDLLTHLKLLLLENADVRKKISRENQFIMIDEFQDTNSLQADIAEMLASEHGNLMVVGDDAQSIYSFRGANFHNIMKFPQRFAGTTITTLEQNYRSTQAILHFTNAIISSAEEKYDKTLFSDIESKQTPVYIRATNFEEQAGFISQRVLELHEEGVRLDQIAILFRAGWHSNELEVELSGKNIPFVKHGGLKFVEAAHVKDLVSFLRILQNEKDAIAWYRQLLLLEGIGPKTAQNIIINVRDSGKGFSALGDKPFDKKKYSDSLRLLRVALEQAKACSTLEDLVGLANKYYRPILKSNYEDHKKRTDDLDSLLRIATRYDSLQTFLDDISLDPPDSTQVGAEASDKEDDKLILSTIHSAKGLEWHSVFVISLIDGYLPSSRSLNTKGEIEEERRLLYVACTRAQRNLYLIAPELSYSRGFSAVGPGMAFSEPSRFLHEIEDFDELAEEWFIDME
jgi:DNA helicase-2/ATP-dependent DNA helicase PcrA